MIRLNFLVDNLGANQMAFQLIGSINEIVEENWASPTVFYDQLHRDCRPLHAPAMNLMEAWRQSGVSIATSLTTVQSLLSMPGPRHKMFYVWDMSWMIGLRRADTYQDIFQHPNLSLIARCDDHKKILQNNFNVVVPYVFEGFDTTGLREAVENECRTS